MNIAIILASGIGSRMNSKIPKQYLKINNKTILEHCFLKFYNNKNIDLILIVINKKWEKFSEDIFKKYSKKKIEFCAGGNSRNESILKSINYLDKNIKILENDIILTHDANRMFIDDKTINENIKLTKKYKCVLTGIPSIDTIYLFDNDNISGTIDRSKLFNSQTPQSFTFEKIKKIINNKNDNFDKIDLGSLAFISNEYIHIYKNLNLNFKITYKEDFELAKKILSKK